jgi:hypothetical protein
MQKCWAKVILLNQTWHGLTFLHPNLICGLSIGGIALGNCILEMPYPTTILGFRVRDELPVLQVPLLDHHTFHIAK